MDVEKPKKKKTSTTTSSLASIPNTIKLSMLNSGLISFGELQLAIVAAKVLNWLENCFPFSRSSDKVKLSVKGKQFLIDIRKAVSAHHIHRRMTSANAKSIYIKIIFSRQMRTTRFPRPYPIRPRSSSSSLNCANSDASSPFCIKSNSPWVNFNCIWMLSYRLLPSYR